MAQYTPNFNLYQPDATDPFEDFRSEFNTNMGIIDNNLGGGGGGGHTIVNENGVDMPAESKLQFTGNVQVTDDNVNGKTLVDIPNSSGSGHTIIDSNGSAMTQRSGLKFTGNVSVTDNAGDNETIVNITGGGGGGIPNAVLLWSGSLSMGGTISVPNLDDYLVIAVQNDVSVLMFGNQFSGVGALGLYQQNNSQQFAYRFNTSVANEISIDNNNRGIITNGGSTLWSSTWCTLTKIYGIIKKPV